MSLKKEKGGFPSDVGKAGVRTSKIEEHLGGGGKRKACRPTPAPGHKAGQLLRLPAGLAERLHVKQRKAPSPAVPELKSSRTTVCARPATQQVGSPSPSQKMRLRYAH